VETMNDKAANSPETLSRCGDEYGKKCNEKIAILAIERYRGSLDSSVRPVGPEAEMDVMVIGPRSCDSAHDSVSIFSEKASTISCVKIE
jgi:hypothetical protein